MSDVERGILIAVVMVISMSVGAAISNFAIYWIVKWRNNRRRKQYEKKLRENKCDCLHCQIERFFLLGETPKEETDPKHGFKLIQFDLNKEKNNDGKPIHGDNT